MGFGVHLINIKKKLRWVSVYKAVESFGVKSCAGFWCKNLCKVLVEKVVQGFAVLV